MKIVIDIPEVFYKASKIVIVSGQRSGKTLMSVICNAVMNGIQLPKGHRRLIAEPTEEDIAKTVGGQSDFAECIRDAVRMVFINAPTIIEADEPESSKS